MRDQIFQAGSSGSGVDDIGKQALVYDHNSAPMTSTQDFNKQVVLEIGQINKDIGKIDAEIKEIKSKKYIPLNNGWIWTVFIAIVAGWWALSVYIAEKPYEATQDRIDDLIKEMQILRCKNNVLSDCYRLKCSSQNINQMKNNCETITK